LARCQFLGVRVLGAGMGEALQRKNVSALAVGRRQAIVFAALAATLPTLWPRAVRGAGANPAEAFVQENVDRAFVILNNAELSDERRYMQFSELILSLMDARRIGMFTLGPYANRASQAEVEAFIAAFSDYTIRFIYRAGFAQTEGNAPKVTGSTQRAADDVVVNCEANGPNAQPIKIAFRVRRSSDGRPIVTDLQVEGVWLALLQRSDFSAFLQQNGGRVADLTADLQRLARVP
jgi:phospholipid transport system substrate-binding protein